MSDPKVTIIIPVYNGANYLRESVGSALAQTYGNCEIIVVNDGSRDGGATEEIAHSFGDRIRYIAKENGGVASALNVGIRNMEGEYFAWLSHDDLFLPDKIESQIKFIADRKDVVAYGDFDIIDSDSKYLSTRRESSIPHELFRYHLVFAHPINGCTVLMPREVFERVGMFDDGLKTIQDYDLWYRIAKEFRFIHQDRVLSQYRIHLSQGSIAVKPECLRERSAFYRRCFDEILSHWDDRCPLSKRYFSIRCALAFDNVGCEELSDYAGIIASRLLASGGLAAWRDYPWLAFFLLFQAKKRLR